MTGDDILTIERNPNLTGMAEVESDIIYAVRGDEDLRLDLIKPWAVNRALERGEPAPRFPAILFIQGSAWTSPKLGFELPQLGALARRGYVIATARHRSSEQGHRFPAFLEDVKSALRFLKAHADAFGIDPERVGLWGTSSGGNAVLLTALTANTGAYTTADYADQSETVKLVVDCFGPTDVHYWYETFDPSLLGLLNDLIGDYATPEGRAAADAMSPLRRLGPGLTLPPMLILHGSADTVVPFEQSRAFYEKLRSLGYDARFVRVEGADHEGDFWSQTVLDLIFNFIDERL